MPALKEAFDLMGDNIVEISTENEALNSQICDFDQKWFKKSKTKTMDQMDDEKRAQPIMSRMNKQINKQY